MMKLIFQPLTDANGRTSPRERNLQLTTVPLMVSLGMGIGIVVLYGLSGGPGGEWRAGTAARLMGTGLVVAGAFLALGMLLGFVFGVPRSAQEAQGDATPPESVSFNHRHRLKVNTNLEQISDWLTKILVGVGLTQLNEIPTQLWRLADFIGKGLSNTEGDRIFATGVILYFFICGFFTGYLLTRLFLAGAFLVADTMSEEAARQAQEAQGAVESLRMEMLTQSAEPSAEDAAGGAPVLESVGASIPAQHVVTWQELAERYNALRKDPIPSAARTRAMGGVIKQMCELARGLPLYDPRSQLQDSDPGRRLFAYAYLMTRPDPSMLASLVDSIIQREDTSFGQYHGLKAVGELMAVADLETAATVAERLSIFLQRLERTSGRYYELRRILDDYRVARKQAS